MKSSGNLFANQSEAELEHVVLEDDDERTESEPPSPKRFTKPKPERPRSIRNRDRLMRPDGKPLEVTDFVNVAMELKRQIKEKEERLEQRHKDPKNKILSDDDCEPLHIGI